MFVVSHANDTQVSLALQYSDNNISISLLFAATLISVIPLSRMLGFLTEDLELRCRSKGLGRLLVVTMGNLVPVRKSFAFARDEKSKC